jgi:hypothetical protein
LSEAGKRGTDAVCSGAHVAQGGDLTAMHPQSVDKRLKVCERTGELLRTRDVGQLSQPRECRGGVGGH